MTCKKKRVILSAAKYPTKPSPYSLSLRGTKCRGNPPEKERKIYSVDLHPPGSLLRYARKDGIFLFASSFGVNSPAETGEVARASATKGARPPRRRSGGNAADRGLYVILSASEISHDQSEKYMPCGNSPSREIASSLRFLAKTKNTSY